MYENKRVVKIIEMQSETSYILLFLLMVIQLQLSRLVHATETGYHRLGNIYHWLRCADLLKNWNLILENIGMTL